MIEAKSERLTDAQREQQTVSLERKAAASSARLSASEFVSNPPVVKENRNLHTAQASWEHFKCPWSRPCI